jgi:L-amino acid N-acyltransferase YncA
MSFEPDQIEIKEAKYEQFHEIWPIFHQVIQSAESYPYYPEIMEDEARDIWFAHNAKVYIAYLNSKPVATRYIIPNKPGLGSHVANTGVMIDKAYRAQGIGKLMMKFAIEKSIELGFKALQLNLVVVNNHASIKICKDYGFKVIGTLPKAFYYKQREYVDAFVMYKELS